MGYVEVARALRRWLAENQLPADGVRLVLSFPDARAKFNAEATIAREVRSLMRYSDDAPAMPLKAFKMCDIDMRLESRADK